MRYIAAYLLAALAGKKAVSEADVKKILASVGIEADDAKVAQVVSELKGKDLEQVIAEGNSKLASVPAAGAAAPAAAAAAPAAGGAKKEEKKEEKKVEKAESEEGDMGFGLFD